MRDLPPVILNLSLPQDLGLNKVIDGRKLLYPLKIQQQLHNGPLIPGVIPALIGNLTMQTNQPQQSLQGIKQAEPLQPLKPERRLTVLPLQNRALHQEAILELDAFHLLCYVQVEALMALHKQVLNHQRVVQPVQGLVVLSLLFLLLDTLFQLLGLPAEVAWDLGDVH